MLLIYYGPNLFPIDNFLVYREYIIDGHAVKKTFFEEIYTPKHWVDTPVSIPPSLFISFYHAYLPNILLFVICFPAHGSTVVSCLGEAW